MISMANIIIGVHSNPYLDDVTSEMESTTSSSTTAESSIMNTNGYEVEGVHKVIVIHNCSIVDFLYAPVKANYY